MKSLELAAGVAGMATAFMVGKQIFHSISVDDKQLDKKYRIRARIKEVEAKYGIKIKIKKSDSYWVEMVEDGIYTIGYRNCHCKILIEHEIGHITSSVKRSRRGLASHRFKGTVAINPFNNSQIDDENDAWKEAKVVVGKEEGFESIKNNCVGTYSSSKWANALAVLTGTLVIVNTLQVNKSK
ncbi:MAG: hypothetical protein AB7W47_17125 [Calditrichaceae bacterium]